MWTSKLGTYLIPELSYLATPEERHQLARQAWARVERTRAGRAWQWIVTPLFAVFGLGFVYGLEPRMQRFIPTAISYTVFFVVFPLALITWWRWMLAPTWRRFVREAISSRGVRICVPCGYDLSGCTGDRCPECGSPIPPPREEHD